MLFDSTGCGLLEAGLKLVILIVLLYRAGDSLVGLLYSLLDIVDMVFTLAVLELETDELASECVDVEGEAESDCVGGGLVIDEVELEGEVGLVTTEKR